MRKVTQGDPLSISARDWNKLADIANGGAIGATPGDGAPNLGGFGAIWVWIKNTSGSDRSRFDCMSLGDLVFDLETNAQQDVIFQAVTADPTKPPAILLEPIANGRHGRAVIDGITYAKVGTSSDASYLYALPNAAGHNLSAVTSGPIRLLAAPLTSAATLRPVKLNASPLNATTAMFLTPVGGIPARTGTSSPYTPGVATCTRCEFYMDAGTLKIRTTSKTDPVANPVPSAVGGSKLIEAKLIDNVYTIDVDPC